MSCLQHGRFINALKENKTKANNEERLVKKGSNLVSLLDSAYIVTTLDGTILEVNVATQHLLGLTEEALVGQDFFGCWVAPNMGKSMINQVVSDKLVRGFITDIKRKDGKAFIASINAQLVADQQNNKKAIECLVSDITERQKKQDEFAETLRSVTGGIAHLINNQMASVVGNADLIRMELSGQPKLSEKLDRIAESGLQISNVAHSLNNFSDTSDNLVMDELYLEDIICSVEQHYRTKVHAYMPRKLIVKAEGNPNNILAHKESLIQMLTGLLNNAVEATEDDGIIIILSKSVTLKHKETGLDEKYVLVSVEDHGHGMDEETQRRIFEPLFSTRFVGRGMSLAQALKTIKKHQGQIRMKTAVGKGSIFKVYFPILE